MSEILIIEDDKRLGPTLMKGLAEQGYDVSLAASGQAALEMLNSLKPGLLVLDLGLPDCDGLDLLQMIRQQGYKQPVLILTARDTTEDKVMGLDGGADDYLVKPFALAELLARVRVLLRRTSSSGQVLKVGDITVDLVTRHVLQGDKTVELTPREFDLLAYLAQHAGQIVSRGMLGDNVWRETSRFTSLDNVIDVHVSHLRRKLTNDSGISPLLVVRGRGIILKGES